MKRAELRDIERLRALRVRKPADLSLVSNVDAIAKDIASEQRAMRRAEDALEVGGASLAMLPESLRGMCAASQVSRGTLTIRAVNAAASHALATWLRGGGEAALCRAVSGVKRVKVRVG